MYQQPSLFDNGNIPVITKSESFHSRSTQEKRVTQKDRILFAIQNLEEPSQSDIHRWTGIPRHLIPDRVKSLLTEAKVRIAGHKIDLLTKKQVTTYEAVR